MLQIQENAWFKKIKIICANGCVFTIHSETTWIYSTPNRAERWIYLVSLGYMKKKKNPGNLGLVIYFVSKILDLLSVFFNFQQFSILLYQILLYHLLISF